MGWNLLTGRFIPICSDLAGVQHVIDYTALLPAGTGEPCGGPESLELFIDGTTHRVGAGVWMDNLEVNDAEVLGTYRGGPFDGTPAVTLKRFGVKGLDVLVVRSQPGV